MAARHVYAVQGFTHLDRTFRKGAEVPADDPMVELRPDLFTQERPEKPKKAPDPEPTEPGEIADVAPIDEESDSPT